jgi:signal transduction histidine kinase
MFNFFIDLPPSDLDRRFDEETRQLVLQRSRVAIFLGVAGLVAMLPVDFMLSDQFPLVVAIRAAASAILLVLLALIHRHPRTAQHAEWLPFSLVATGGVSLFLLMSLAGDPTVDAHHAFHESCLLVLIVGAGAIFPIGARRLLPPLAIPVVLEIAEMARFPLRDVFPPLFLVGFTVVIALVVSESAYRLRRMEYAGRVAQETLQRARSDFVAMITHDIKSPLGVIKGWLDLLEDGDPADADQPEMMRGIRAATGSALLLANNLLDVSRISSRPLELKPEPTDLEQLLAQVISSQNPISEVKSLRVVFEAEPGLPLVKADERLLHRVFANLVDNASKFAPQGGEVRVSVRRAGDGVEVVVEDDGPGIPTELDGKLFERFGDVSRRRDSTGLGLFIVKSMTEAHGGSVSGGNRSSTRGARFQVWLPVGRHGEEATSPPQKPC